MDGCGEWTAGRAVGKLCEVVGKVFPDMEHNRRRWVHARLCSWSRELVERPGKLIMSSFLVYTIVDPISLRRYDAFSPVVRSWYVHLRWNLCFPVTA